MIRKAPGFWTRRDSLSARLLGPVSALVSAETARRLRRPGWRAPVSVICIGNATVGGAGKTTVGLDVCRRLLTRGIAVHVLLRGYGGSARGLQFVRLGDSAAFAGDEALLYAPLAPTWIGANRAVSAEAAVSAGAELLLMDNGLQNAALTKDISLLVIDGARGFGNGRVFPAGPLREPIARAAARCRAAVVIGTDEWGVLAALPSGLPVLRARLAPELPERWPGQKVVAFAGIAFPDKFFTTLAEVGADIVERHAFPDHHQFRAPELQQMVNAAERTHAVLVTTAKDFVRLPAPMRENVEVLRVSLRWDDESAIEKVLAEAR